jgi:putative flippase GtrA
MKNEKLRTEIFRTLKFVLFSASAGIVQVLSFALLNELLQVTHWVAYLISLILSVIWNFTFCRKFTFRSNTNPWLGLLKLCGFYIVFTPLSTWWTAALTEPAYGILWNEYLVLAITMISNFVLEYLYDTFVVFRGTIDSAVEDKEKA